MKPHIILSLLLLFLTITQPALFFIINGIENPNELTSHSVSYQSSLEDSLGLDLDKFEPGKQYDINGANFTVGEQDILVKPDEGVKYIKFGLQAIGDKAALFGGWAPVGIIEHLPANEKFKVVGFDNVVEIELENTNGGLTKSINVSLNGETVINKTDEMSVMVFVEISEGQDLKISFRDSEDKKIKITEDLKTGEETFGDEEVQLLEFERDQISNFKGIGSQAGAMIKKLSKTDLEDLKNAKVGPMEDEQRDTIDIIVFEREVVVMQDGSNIGSFVLEAQTVLKFLDKDEETIQVVLTPKGVTGVKGDVLLSGEHIGSKTAKSQLEIKIKLSSDGIELDMEADKVEIEELGEKMTKEKKVYPRDYLIYKQL